MMTNSSPAFPKHLLIETTTRCNLRCKQCAHVIGKYALADMTLETFHKLRPLFPHAEQVALYGHGETFLCQHFFEMLEELKRHDLSVYVTTNGTLITEDVARRLVDLELDKLAFSLDAATPDLFNEIRRGADFEAILRNIHTLNALKKAKHRDDKPVLSIMYCAMKSNIQELPKLVRLADELNMTHGVSVMNISEYGTSGECLLHYPELAERYLNEANQLAAKLAVPLGGLHEGFEDVHVQLAPIRLSLADKIYRNYREFRRSFDRSALLKFKLLRLRDRIARNPVQATNGSALPSPTESDQADSSQPMLRVKKCRDPWEFLFVDVHGNIRPCCTSHRIMGNVHDEDIMAIWQNSAYQAFRTQMVSADIPPECKTCLRREWQQIPAAACDLKDTQPGD
ncbi:radical SAM protein [candidate division KSB3 bacterium]|uniref:Radical SAM protein n=1 Tax=candidate division KSB3 bacterium TaxID=2044937 RepID=A0A9D5JUV0_9BACT|nr:radical SAM protein [candidate division KSB3 bacterium]MBD3324071.1 radical SAM protein [candidate division KSB3 bacterium]